MEGISEEERVATHESWDKIIRWGHRRDYKNREADRCPGQDKQGGRHGGGSFGTAMATLLARNKDTLDVVILVRSQADADAINDTHRNAKYLPEYELPPQISRHCRPCRGAVGGADFIVHAVPVQSSKTFLAGVKEYIDPETPLLCLSKGLEVGSCEMMSEVIPAGLGRDQPLAVLSGPTFAVELMQGLPTAIVAASTDKDLAVSVQRLFASSCLRGEHVHGRCGRGDERSFSLKNVLAIAAAWSTASS